MVAISAEVCWVSCSSGREQELNMDLLVVGGKLGKVL
jgi:hypothetical protein